MSNDEIGHAAVRTLDGLAAAIVVGDWGYWRAPIEPKEIESSRWFSYGPHVIWWVNEIEEAPSGDVTFHVCVEPGWRVGRVYARKLLYAIEIVAEIIGAQGITVLSPADRIGDYLSRMGWKRAHELDTPQFAAFRKELPCGS